MTEQTALSFSGVQGAGQQPEQNVSLTTGGAEAGGAQAQYVTLEDAKRMVQEAVNEALAKAQSHTDKSIAHLNEQIASKAPAAQAAAQAPGSQSSSTEAISQERIEWAARETQNIYNKLGAMLTDAEEDAPYRALLDISTPEAFIKSLPAAVMAKVVANLGEPAPPTEQQPQSTAAARAASLASGGMPTRSDYQFSDIPDLISRGLDQSLPRGR